MYVRNGAVIREVYVARLAERAKVVHGITVGHFFDDFLLLTEAIGGLAGPDLCFLVGGGCCSGSSSDSDSSSSKLPSSDSSLPLSSLSLSSSSELLESAGA